MYPYWTWAGLQSSRVSSCVRRPCPLKSSRLMLTCCPVCASNNHGREREPHLALLTLCSGLGFPAMCNREPTGTEIWQVRSSSTTEGDKPMRLYIVNHIRDINKVTIDHKWNVFICRIKWLHLQWQQIIKKISHRRCTRYISTQFIASTTVVQRGMASMSSSSHSILGLTLEVTITNSFNIYFVMIYENTFFLHALFTYGRNCLILLSVNACKAQLDKFWSH